MTTELSTMDQVESISKDILQKLSEVKDGSRAQKFLLIKKEIIDRCVKVIIDNAQINKYEYELYSLFEICENLRNKISMKECRPTDDDEDMTALKKAREQMQWIRQTKLKGVNLTQLSKQLN